jgi:predicted ATPase
MIKQIKITHFYSFKETTIDLHPETNILIGINGSGKSNFLRVIRLLREGVGGVGLKKHIYDHLGGFDNCLFKGVKREQSQSIDIQFTLDGAKITEGEYGYRFTDDILYEISISKSAGNFTNYYIKEKISTIKGFNYLNFESGIGFLTERVLENNSHSNKRVGETQRIKYTDFDQQELVLAEISDSERYPALVALKRAIKDIMVYDYFDTTPKSLIRKPMLPTSERRLLADGTNLTQILNTIKINHKAQYRKIIEMLQEVNPNFSGFDFNLVGTNIELMLEENGLDSSIHVSAISDGTLRYLCLLAVLYNPERGRLICIDEPEVGLHPDMILNIANAIKEASEGSTMIISTHSENLLNYFEIENAKVFGKDEHNSTTVTSYTQAQFEGWYEEFTLGKMWRQGDLGGVRYGN